jgi:hypothetical protein
MKERSNALKTLKVGGSYILKCEETILHTCVEPHVDTTEVPRNTKLCENRSNRTFTDV